MHKRLEYINKEENILYLSIHVNSFPSDKIHGSQVFYNGDYEECKSLAVSIQNQLIAFDKTNKRSAKCYHDKYLLDNASITGVIVELGFITNYEDREVLVNDKLLDLIMMHVYIGTLNYLSS